MICGQLVLHWSAYLVLLLVRLLLVLLDLVLNSLAVTVSYEEIICAAYISDLMYSSRFSTFALASVGSCWTSAGPTSLKIVLSAFNVLNS